MKLAVAHEPVRCQDPIAKGPGNAVPPTPPQTRGHPRILRHAQRTIRGVARAHGTRHTELAHPLRWEARRKRPGNRALGFNSNRHGGNGWIAAPGRSPSLTNNGALWDAGRPPAPNGGCRPSKHRLPPTPAPRSYPGHPSLHGWGDVEPTPTQRRLRCPRRRAQARRPDCNSRRASCRLCSVKRPHPRLANSEPGGARPRPRGLCRASPRTRGGRRSPHRRRGDHMGGPARPARGSPDRAAIPGSQSKTRQDRGSAAAARCRTPRVLNVSAAHQRLSQQTSSG